MRKMLLGIYLALLGIGILLGVENSGLRVILALGFFFCSIYFTLDGYFSWGPTARAEEDENSSDIPPQYK